MNGAPSRLLGFDNRGEVYHADNVVLRRVRPEYRDTAAAVYRLYEKHRLHLQGIVETELRESEEYLFQHRKLLVTYPAEWSVSMLKDAALFHLKLLQDLPKFGLTLKDALPNNILFDRGRPCFVDFLSLVRIDDLQHETWLVRQRRKDSDLRSTVLRNMFLPFFLTPLVAMSTGKFDLARNMLARQACSPAWNPPRIRQIMQTRINPRFLGRILEYRALIEATRYLRPERAYRALERFILKLDTNPSGGYADYYKRKSEDFPLDARELWKAKQRSVYEVLSKLQPASVLDLGANTGWFSRLAESLGAEVVSVDVDEASLDQLYRLTKTDGRRIVPLKIPFGKLGESIAVEGGEHGNCVLFTSPIERLGCDVVMMLGLIHHLVLGEGRSFDSILSILRRLSKHAVLVEFVSLSDPLIAGNPGYFPKLSDADLERYNIQAFVDAAKAHFQSHEILDSHPDSRKIVLLY